MRRGMFAWAVIRNQHRSEVIWGFKRLAAWLALPADQLSGNAAGNYIGGELGFFLIKGVFFWGGCFSVSPWYKDGYLKAQVRALSAAALLFI